MGGGRADGLPGVTFEGAVARIRPVIDRVADLRLRAAPGGDGAPRCTVVILPLNPRVGVLFGTAFITSNRVGPDGGYRENWGVLGGVLVPVAGPQPFDDQPPFSLTRGFRRRPDSVPFRGHRPGIDERRGRDPRHPGWIMNQVHHDAA